MRNEHCLVCGIPVNNKEHSSYTYCSSHNGQVQVDHEIENYM
jgi:uncharacterized Zn finger protein (UPF0148 family)